MKFRPATSRRQQQQGGFILLVVFLMAAAVALMLYSQLPRIAFESEREKEQLLIERGEQYIRAIDLYRADNGNLWPQSIEDLERGKNKRYLRRRYIDPYTGKDDWRIIHTNGTQLTDSLVEKPTTDASGNPITASASTTAQPNQGPQVNAAVLERPSDTTLPGAQQFGVINPLDNNANNPVVGPVTQPGGVTFGVPGAGLPQGVQLPGNVQTKAGPGGQPGGFQPQFPGQQFPGQQPPPGVQVTQPGGFQPQFPGQQFPGQQPPAGVQTNNAGFQPQFPGQQFPGQQPPPGVQLTNPGATQGGQQLGVQLGPNGQQAPPGFAFGPNGQLLPAPVGAPLPGQAGGPQGVGNAGVNAIQQLLTTPRAAPAGVNVPTNNAVGGGGIAGVASKHTGPSIKVYNDRQKYEEWEFVSTRNVNAGGVGGVGGQPGGVPGQIGPGQNGGRTGPGGPGQPPGQNGGGIPGGPGGFGPGGFGQGGFGTQPAGGGRGGAGGGPGVGGGIGPGVGGAAPGAGRGR